MGHFSMETLDLPGSTLSGNQQEWIRQARSALGNDQSLSEEERAELAGAVEGMFNFGALEKTRRLIRWVARDDLLPRWDELYRGRSQLFHGSRYLTNAEVLEMAGTASTLCGEIVNAYVDRLTSLARKVT